jgi:hypothetical protein
MSISDYEELIADRKKHSRLFSGGLIGLAATLAMAQDRGPTAGWSWLVWSVEIAVFALWA